MKKHSSVWLPLWIGGLMGMGAFLLTRAIPVAARSSATAALTSTTRVFLPVILARSDNRPPEAQFGAADYTALENAGEAQIEVQLTFSASQVVTVRYATADITATAPADYLPVTGTLTFAPGQTSQVITVTIVNDSLDEPAEALTVSLAEPVNAVLNARSTARLTILDDDVVSPFSLQIAALHLVEGGGGGGALSAEADLLARQAFITLTNALAESGAAWTRVYINWSYIQPLTPTEGLPPVYSWSYYDPKLQQVAGTGVQMIGTIANAPGWAAATACAPFYSDRLDEFAQFLTTVVNRYRQAPYHIKHWEMINEPDGTLPNLGEGGLGCWGYQPGAYAQMLSLAYATIKAADPEATVIMGGVAHDWFTEYGGPFYRYFPDNIMTAGAGSSVDVLAFHYFPDYHAEWERWDPNSPDRLKGWLPPPTCGDLFDGAGVGYAAGGIDLIAKASHFRNRLAACFGLNQPVWVTELAQHGYPGDTASLANQAQYVIKGYARGLAAGVANITWYSLDRPPYDSYEQSLLYADFSPKPAFYAYKTLTGELTGYEYRQTLSLANVEGYVFSTPFQHDKTVAWGAGQVSFAVSAAERLRVVDRTGHEIFVTDGGAGDVDGALNGVVQLQLADDPLFIETVN